jgi:hypothetical protein
MEKFCDKSYLGRSKLEKLVMDDRISELPDELLIHILSLLPPKFAYTTCLLSKRWKALCQFLTVLRFDDKFVKDEEEFLCFNHAIDKNHAILTQTKSTHQGVTP